MSWPFCYSGTSISREKFWLEEPIWLLQQMTLIPQCGMSPAARLNALTRLILVITLILYLCCFGQWWLFLLLGLLLVIILYYTDPAVRALDNYSLVENYTCPRRTKVGYNERRRSNQDHTILIRDEGSSFQPYD